jgi:hypothetical protein
MKRIGFPRLAASICVALTLSLQVAAQGLVDAQRTRAALSSFPDSDAILFVNLQKIINTALPRFLPPAELKKLHAEPQKLGFDIKGLEYAIIGMRLTNPPRPEVVPDVVVLVRGTFNAESLLALARLGLDSEGVQARSEQYGSKTIEIVDVKSLDKKEEGKAGGGDSPVSGVPYKELAATALDANTLVLGVPEYVRATIDAAGAGQGQLDAGLINLATRDESSLFSLTAELPESLPDYLHKAGTPPNKELDEMIGWLKQVSVSSGMTPLDLTLKAAVHTDTAEHASAISGLVKMGLSAAESAIESDMSKKRGSELQDMRSALAAIRAFTNTVEGNTVLLGVSVPQQTIAAVVQRNMNKPKSSGKAPATTRRRRTRRKT